MDVASWLRDLGLGRYEATFRENDVELKCCPISTAERSQAAWRAIGHAATSNWTSRPEL